MSGVFSVPLQVGIPQVLSIILHGLPYTLKLQYRDTDQGGWFLDIADSNAVPILSGVPLITGADLLEQYVYLGLGGGLRVQTASNPDAVPTFDNLGSDGLLYWVEP